MVAEAAAGDKNFGELHGMVFCPPDRAACTEPDVPCRAALCIRFAARVGAGAGLGLSIVAGIAAEHQGTASAANAVDGGAVFTLQLPLT